MHRLMAVDELGIRATGSISAKLKGSEKPSAGGNSIIWCEVVCLQPNLCFPQPHAAPFFTTKFFLKSKANGRKKDSSCAVRFYLSKNYHHDTRFFLRFCLYGFIFFPGRFGLFDFCAFFIATPEKGIQKKGFNR